MRGVRPALLSAVAHVQTPNPLERLDDSLVADLVPFTRWCRGDGERGLKLVDEDLTAEPEVRRTWNALQEEAHDCRRSLVRSHAVQIDGVDVGAFVVASPEGARGLTLGGIGVVEVFEQGRPEVGRADVPCWFLNAAFEY